MTYVTLSFVVAIGSVVAYALWVAARIRSVDREIAALEATEPDQWRQ